MAINPATQYPGKIDTSDPDGYPYGKAQNVAVSGDGTGTPWEKALINDLFGLGQALLSEAGTTPTGTPDKVGASQYLDAILSLKRKNYIVNPSMAVSQEHGDGPVVVDAGVDHYVADQFSTSLVTLSGASIEASIEALGGLRAARLTVTTPSSDLSGNNFNGRILTRLEANNVAGLGGKAACLSAVVNTNWTGNLAVSVRNAAGNRSYVVDVPVETGVNAVVIPLTLEANTIGAPSNGVGLSIDFGFCNEGALRGSSANNGVWQDGALFCSDASTQWTKTSGNYLEITAVKLEEGTVPSAFEPNSYATDLAECQRYFYTEDDIFHTAYSDVVFNFIIDHPFKVSMRATPVVTLKNLSGVIGGGSSVTATEVTTEKFATQTSSSSGVARAGFTATANARL